MLNVLSSDSFCETLQVQPFSIALYKYIIDHLKQSVKFCFYHFWVQVTSLFFYQAINNFLPNSPAISVTVLWYIPVIELHDLPLLATIVNAYHGYINLFKPAGLATHYVLVKCIIFTAFVFCRRLASSIHYRWSPIQM